MQQLSISVQIPGELWFAAGLRAQRIRGRAGAACPELSTWCRTAPPQPRTVRTASVRSVAAEHIYRWLLLQWPFNQGCFLQPASPPRCHWKREGGESRRDALPLDYGMVNQRLARPPGALDLLADLSTQLDLYVNSPSCHSQISCCCCCLTVCLDKFCCNHCLYFENRALKTIFC